VIVALILAAGDRVVKAHLREIPKEYVPLTEDEIREFRRVNVWRAAMETGGPSGHPSASRLPYPTDTLIRDFEGIRYTRWIPPDPQLAAGGTHVGVVVNSNIAFLRKESGEVDYSNSLRGFFISVIPYGGLAFDPKIAYDIPAGRWLVLALYYNSASRASYYLLAVSEGDDPLGGWYYYLIDAKYDDTTYRDNWADYPEIGFNDRWIVLTSQQVGFSGYDYYPKVRLLNKDSAYSGTLSGWIEDFTGSDLGCIYNWPRVSRSTYDYSRDIYVIAFNHMYRISGPTSSPQISPCITLSLSPFSAPPNAPQGGGYDPLEVAPATFQVLYMDGKLYYTFQEEHPLQSTLASGRFVVLDTAGFVSEDVALYESGMSWIYPAVAVSPKGVAVSFTRVGTLEGDYPSAAYVARSSSDPAFSPPRVYGDGTTWYFNDHGYGRNRWGDYFGGAADPADSSLWVIAEYPPDDTLWTTHVANISFSRVSVMEAVSSPADMPARVYSVDGRLVPSPRARGIYFTVEGGKVRKLLLNPYSRP